MWISPARSAHRRRRSISLSRPRSGGGEEFFSAHSRASGNPEASTNNEVPAFAGTSGLRIACSMPVAGGGADRAEDRGSVFLEHAANRLLRADLAHFALALDDRGGHQRLDVKLAQGRRDFFHLGGAALAMARHAFEIVGNDLRPIEAGIIVL